MCTSVPFFRRGIISDGTSSQKCDSGAQSCSAAGAPLLGAAASSPASPPAAPAARAGLPASSFEDARCGSEKTALAAAVSLGTRLNEWRTSSLAARSVRKCRFSSLSFSISARCLSFSARNLAFSAVSVFSVSRISAGGSAGPPTSRARASRSLASSRAWRARTWFSSLACSLKLARSTRYFLRPAHRRKAACRRTAARRAREN
mmetsp:Transcript_94551/g.276290  ORF Transcript_94551/g.276290 Transcript_94551/m.276290 type:complete len:204 (-) Transcript_94551:2897-3508(-)